jgi:hypothetical protein
MKQAAIITTLLIAAVVTTMTASANSPVASKATAKRNTVQRIRSKDDTWSIPVTSNILSSDTAMHQKPGRNSEMTYGAFDISAPVGTPVFAPCEGEVVHASKANEAGYGHNVRIRCSATGLEIWIAHLKALWAKKGQEVAEHTQVGTVGRTGITSFNHVHITLRGKGASEIEEHFDLSLFHWSPFHSPSNIGDYEWDGRYTNAKDPLDAIFGAEDGEQQSDAMLFISLACYFGLTIIIQMMAREKARNRVMLAGAAHGFCMVFIFINVLTGSLSMPQSSVTTGSDYERVVDFTLGWEGWKCTHDPVRTMGGITNTTYQGWLKSQGLPLRDVCDSLTKDERKKILHDLYWMPIASKHEWPLNAAIFDTQVGSGQGVAADILEQYTTFDEYQKARKTFYWGMSKLPHSYRAAWVRRTNELTDYISKEN